MVVRPRGLFSFGYKLRAVLFIYFLKELFAYLLAVLGLRCCLWAFSSFASWSGSNFLSSHRGGFSCGAWALGCTGFRGCSAWAQQLWCSGPSRSSACGLFPDRGSNPCSLHWQADSSPPVPPGKPCCSLLETGALLNSWPPSSVFKAIQSFWCHLSLTPSSAFSSTLKSLYG